MCFLFQIGLGVHFSKVRSIHMDDFDDHFLKLLLASGNLLSKSIFEECIQAGWEKPLPESSRETKEKWIKSKYVWKGFISLEKSEECDNFK